MGMSEGACYPKWQPFADLRLKRLLFIFFVAGTARFEKKLSFEEYHRATMTEQLAENWKKPFKDVI